MSSTLFFICGFFYITRKNLYEELMFMGIEDPESERDHLKKKKLFKRISLRPGHQDRPEKPGTAKD